MPQWHFRKRPHRVRVAGTGEGVLRAVSQVTWSEVPLFSSLLRVASFGRVRRDPDRPVLEEFLAGGFVELSRTGRELVMAAVSGGEPFPEDEGGARLEWFLAYAEPRSTKVAFSFRYADGVLSTETRVFGADESARRRFRGYWALIRLPAGLVRREILHAVRRRLET
ncbi:hypothetical protein [Streptomyces sp. JHA26]|uniref:hypothetical protein n=1 Tax=Streptomyces sp. JHA26 TaxID=1917143 RepID=UPI00098B5D0C|nr:hypothetical protein [Streptomyces sp. JHA26]